MENKKMNPFRGFRAVFSFSFKNNTSTKGFKRVTIIVAILCFIAGLAGLGIIAFSQKDSGENYESSFETIYFLNQTSLDTQALYQLPSMPGYEKVTVKPVTGTHEQWSKTCMDSDAEDVVVEMTMKENVFSLELFLANGSSSSDADNLLTVMSDLVSQSKLASLNLSPEDMQLAITPATTEFTTAGKEPDSVASIFAQLVIPMLTILLIYMMVLLYGQSIGKAVSAEKTSKVMDTILTSVAPYALIGGKVLAAALVGIIQFVIWGASIVLGLVAGGYAGSLIYSGFVNPISEFFLQLRAIQIGSVFTPWSVILGCIALCLGFLFYCSLAGMVASGIKKTEEQAQGMSMFQVLVVIGFMASYFTSFNQSDDVLREVIRWVPLTSAFILPSDIMVGNVSILMSCLYVVVLFIFTVLMIIFTGKIYRDTIFYNGSNNWFMRLCGKRG